MPIFLSLQQSFINILKIFVYYLASSKPQCCLLLYLHMFTNWWIFFILELCGPKMCSLESLLVKVLLYIVSMRYVHTVITTVKGMFAVGRKAWRINANFYEAKQPYKGNHSWKNSYWWESTSFIIVASSVLDFSPSETLTQSVLEFWRQIGRIRRTVCVNSRVAMSVFLYTLKLVAFYILEIKSLFCDVTTCFPNKYVSKILVRRISIV